MEYRKLGNSGLKVSEIGLGGRDFGGQVGEQESISIISHAIDLGINFIDTSNVYNEGRSEEFVGKALKSKRSDVIIATKFGMPMLGTPTGERPNRYGGSRYHIMEAIEASLKRLCTDYIDLYYMHWPDMTTPIEETLRTLDDLIRDGKVRYIGCSNFYAWQLCEALWTSRVNNLSSFVVVQMRYNFLDRRIEEEVVPCCQEHNVSVVPWGPLAEGFLTGIYQRGRPVQTGSRLDSSRPAPERKPAGPTPFVPILTDTNFDKLEKMQKFSAERGHSVSELAIAWLLSHSWLTSVIAGVASPEEVSANAAASGWKLTPQEIAQLD